MDTEIDAVRDGAEEHHDPQAFIRAFLDGGRLLGPDAHFVVVENPGYAPDNGAAPYLGCETPAAVAILTEMLTGASAALSAAGGGEMPGALTLHVSRGEAGLWYVTSPSRPGLLVAEPTWDAAWLAVPGALADLDAAAPSPSQGSDMGEAGRDPKGSGHSRAEPSGLGASPECPSRGATVVARELSAALRRMAERSAALSAEYSDHRHYVHQGRARAYRHAAWLANLPHVCASDEHPEGEDAIAAEGQSPASAVPEGQAPEPPTAPQGADLAGLSAAAPAGTWHVDEYEAHDEDGGPSEIACEGICTHDGGGDEVSSIACCNRRVAEFVCALVNDYRAGRIGPTTSAPPAPAEDQDLVRRACLLHQKWLSAFADDTWTGPEVQHADVTLLLDLATRLDRLSRKAAPPASAAGQEPGLPIDITDALPSSPRPKPKREDSMSSEDPEMDAQIAAIRNPPGYGATVGAVVLLEPAEPVIEAACDAFFRDPKMTWAMYMRASPELADEIRARMRKVVRAIVHASGGQHAQ